MMTTPIELSGLRKVYRAGLAGRITALDGVDLRVEKGEVFGLLGPNGAGKTTAVKVLLGLTFPTQGEARLLGIPSANRESRRRVGYLPEGHRFPGYLTPRQTLSIFGRMSGVPAEVLRSRIPTLLERVRLTAWIDVRVKRFSKGMTQRLGLAAALVHEPEVLLLDEPTDGVDPVGRREIRDILLAARAAGTTIFINSHLLSEVERTCDRVAILHRGRVIREGTVAGLTAPTHRFRLRLAGGAPPPAERLQGLGARVTNDDGAFEVEVPDLETLNRLIDTLRAERALIAELAPLRPELEDVFVEVIGEEEAR